MRECDFGRARRNVRKLASVVLLNVDANPLSDSLLIVERQVNLDTALVGRHELRVQRVQKRERDKW